MDGLRPSEELARWLEQTTSSLLEYEAIAHLYFLDNEVHEFLEIMLYGPHTALPRMVQLTLSQPTAVEKVKKCAYLVFIKPPNSSGETEIFLVITKTKEVYNLHITPGGQRKWREPPDSRLIRTILSAV